MTSTLDRNQPREQVGSVRAFPLVVGLVDYKKAFDSVEIPDVIDALKEQGVEPVYVNVLQHIYKYAKSYIRLHKDSKRFRLRRGVRQGDTSSRKLFIAFLEKVFRTTMGN